LDGVCNLWGSFFGLDFLAVVHTSVVEGCVRSIVEGWERYVVVEAVEKHPVEDQASFVDDVADDQYPVLNGVE